MTVRACVRARDSAAAAQEHRGDAERNECASLQFAQPCVLMRNAWTAPARPSVRLPRRDLDPFAITPTSNDNMGTRSWAFPRPGIPFFTLSPDMRTGWLAHKWPTPFFAFACRSMLLRRAIGFDGNIASLSARCV